jgi:hypothetical protein
MPLSPSLKPARCWLASTTFRSGRWDKTSWWMATLCASRSSSVRSRPEMPSLRSVRAWARLTEALLDARSRRLGRRTGSHALSLPRDHPPASGFHRTCISCKVTRSNCPWPVITAQTDPGRVKVVANLPYAISSPWMEGVLTGVLPSRLVLMLQKEAADRYGSPHGSKTFGAISIFSNRPMISLQATRFLRPVFTLDPRSTPACCISSENRSPSFFRPKSER